MVALAAATAGAGTSLWVQSDPDDPVGGGLTRAFGSADGTFTGQIGVVTVDTQPAGPGSNRLDNREAVAISFTPGTGDVPWRLVFSPAPLAPGTYEGAQAHDPLPPGVPKFMAAHIIVPAFGPREPCGQTTGRFTITELVRSASGELVSFAADFEQRCRVDGREHGTLRGAVRYHVGDASCAAATDGAPCDDGNPCSHDDACRGGECTGTVPPDACNPTTCDDGNVCTDDTLDAATGCTSPAVDGTCWAFTRGTLRTFATVGRTCGCRIPTSGGVLALRADGTFRVPGGRLPASECPSHEGVTLPDEVGFWRAAPGGRRLRLKTKNLAALVAAAEVCAGRNGRVRGYHTRARLSADGEDITMVTRFAVHLRALPVPVFVVSRSTGHRGTGERRGPTSSAVSDVGQICAAQVARCFAGR